MMPERRLFLMISQNISLPENNRKSLELGSPSQFYLQEYNVKMKKIKTSKWKLLYLFFGCESLDNNYLISI